jgi:hypothetical protein
VECSTTLEANLFAYREKLPRYFTGTHAQLHRKTALRRAKFAFRNVRWQHFRSTRRDWRCNVELTTGKRRDVSQIADRLGVPIALLRRAGSERRVLQPVI